MIRTPLRRLLAVREEVPLNRSLNENTMIFDQPLFAVDIGNTRAKICFWSFRAIRNALSYDVGTVRVAPACDDEKTDPSSSFEETEEWLHGLEIDEKPCRWVVSSVNAQKTNSLKKLIQRYRPNDSFVPLTLRDIPIDVEYDHPEKLGLDRATAAFAGLTRLGKGVPFLVVDVGTAATIDYVDSEGVFKGGSILPGPRLTAEALSAKTAQLPMLKDPENSELARQEDELRSPLAYPATETSSAIRLGVVFTLVGAIASFYWKTRRRIIEEGRNPNRLSLVLSGGNARSTEYNLLSYFDDLDFNLRFSVPRPRMYVEPRLVLDGIFEIATSLPFNRR